ncbi:MAG: NAD(P)H-dependent oxidoreductase [Verrucomicrobia bacterium]|nr:NAD(P)H-dependent oxidoreductase [Verrucomicrobiota bacterium]
MVPLPPSAVLEALKWRYATKKFDPVRKIPDATWSALEESLVLTPSSYGVQPWKFLVIDDPALRARLLPASWGQKQVVEASHLVVFALRKDVDAAHLDRYMARAAEVRATTVEALAPFRKVIDQSLDGARAAGTLDHWQSRQLYIALGQFMLAAALLGIDTCPMEGLVPAQYDEILGLKGTAYTTLAACPAGYRAADDKYAATPKVRFPVSEVIVHV